MAVAAGLVTVKFTLEVLLLMLADESTQLPPVPVVQLAVPPLEKVPVTAAPATATWLPSWTVAVTCARQKFLNCLVPPSRSPM